MNRFSDSSPDDILISDLNWGSRIGAICGALAGLFGGYAILVATKEMQLANAMAAVCLAAGLVAGPIVGLCRFYFSLPK